MILLKRKTIPSREKRLNTLNAYIGEAGMLLQRLQQDNEMRQWIRTFTQTTVDDVICALQLIGSLQNVGVVIHGPRGCSASQFYFDNSQHGRLRNGWAVTNLDEKDTIMGGEDSLREAILTLHNRHHPDAIFVVATPVVAINNDDVSSVAIELQEELGIKVIPVYSDGFKSRTGITGYDAALHAVMRHLPMEQRKTQEKFVNLLAVAENRHNVDEIQRLIQALGLEANILPQGAVLQNFIEASHANLSIGLNADYGDILGQVLEENYQVPYLRIPAPIGIKGTHHWLSALGKAVGLNSKVENLHARESDKIAALLEKYDFSGVKAYINLPTATAWGVMNLVEEIGAQVIGLTVHHIDKLHQQMLTEIADKKPNLPVRVASGQLFEQVNILKRLEPDVYIGSAADTAWTAKSGITAITVDQIPVLGYQGVATVSHQLQKALVNRSFVRTLKGSMSIPYKEGWYAKKPNWYIKSEVK